MIRSWRRRIAAGLGVLALVGVASSAAAQEPLVQIYIVRHPEAELAPADPKAIHLTDAGRQRASLLAPTLAGVRVTHLVASHTLRTRELLEGLAAERALPIVQLPTPGSVLNGQVVTDEVPRREAIAPVADALLALPAGSVAVAALNSDNIYAVLNRLGVPVAEAGRTCSVGQMCVPCLNNTCYPGEVFDRLWYLVLRPGQPGPLVFAELRYGVGWVPR